MVQKSVYPNQGLGACHPYDGAEMVKPAEMQCKRLEATEKPLAPMPPPRAEWEEAGLPAAPSPPPSRGPCGADPSPGPLSQGEGSRLPLPQFPWPQ